MTVLVLVAACAEHAPPPAPTPETPGLLPAHQTAAERLSPAKGDDQSDYRLAHPEWYAVTVPPTGAVRAMREWDPMSVLLTAWPAYLGADKGARETVVAMIGHTVLTAQTDVGVIVEAHQGAQDVIAALLAWGLTEQDIAARVAIWQIPIDSVWLIDYGPLPVVDEALGRVGFVDFRYYKGRVLDDAMPSRLALAGAAPSGLDLPVTVWRAPFDVEGGNLQADGEGGCYTSGRALQNTGATQAELGQVLDAYAGCKRLVVMQDLSDDATGHIDMFFKLARRDLAIVGAFDGAVVIDEPNGELMDQNAALLAGTPLPDGTPMQVLRMPFPSRAGKVPRTFLNATLVNGVNLWPVYTDDGAGGALQAQASAVWEQALPGWEHVPILADRLAELSGTIHCISRTVPAMEAAPVVAPGACADGLCDGPADGYDGACQTSTDCQGARWLCPCPVCNGLCGPAPCGDVPDVGACAGRARLACIDGVVQVEACAGCCAIDPATGLAACTADCDGCAPECDASEGGCGGDDHAWRCEEVDGCPRRIYDSCDGGGCMEGACRGCAGIGEVGCCGDDGAVAMACGAEGLADAACGAGTTCGWDALGGFYACVPDDQALLEDPSREHPVSCPGACAHACAIGSSGCSADGGSWWSCAAGPDGCRVRKDTQCLPGRSCVDEACVGPGEGGGSGGSGGGGDAEPDEATGAGGCGAGRGAGAWSALLLAALAGWRRAQSQRAAPGTKSAG